MSTIFHKIVSGEIPCYKIYEDDNYLAFLDVSPVSEGHTLVIPKKFYEKVWDLPEAEIGEYFKVCKKIANHFQSVVGRDRVYSMIIGEGVAYAHIHLIPDVDGEFLPEFVSSLKPVFNLLEDSDKANEITKKYRLD